MDISLDFPFGGVSEALALSKQVPGTTRRGDNVTGLDAVSGRQTGAQRRGMRKFVGQALSSGSPVQALDVCVFDSKGVDFAGLAVGSDTKQWAALSSTGEPAHNPVLDSQKNCYLIEGKSTIVKRNSDGAVVWIHQVAMPVAEARLSALAIDFDTDVLYTGVGTTVQMDDPIGKVFEPKGFLVRLKQKKDGKVETTWKLPVDGYIGNIKVVKSELYMTVDVPQRGQSRLERYTALAGPTAPTLDAGRAIPFPCSGMAVRNTGTVYTTHPPDPKRGLDPRVPKSTTETSLLKMWTPEKLKRIPNMLFPDEAPLNLLWSWHEASDLDVDLDTGDNVLHWPDRSENGRHLGSAYGIASANVQPDPPKFARLSLGAEPGVRFSCDEVSPPTRLSGLSSGPNLSTHQSSADQQAALIPSYRGNTYVICVLAKAAVTSVVSPLILQPSDFSAAAAHSFSPGADMRRVGLYMNAKGLLFAQLTQVGVAANSGRAFMAQGSHPIANQGPNGFQQPTAISQATMDTENGFCLFTLIYRGPQNSGSPSPIDTTTSQFYYNGSHVQSFEAFDFYGALHTNVGWEQIQAAGTSTLTQAVRGFAGDILEIVSVDTGVTTDAANTSARALKIAQLTEGYMAHRIGMSHKLDAAHPYHLLRGPPPAGALTGGVANPNTAKLASENSILAKWGPARFDLKAVLTDDDATTASDQGYGYACEVEPDQAVDSPSQFLYAMGATAPGAVFGGTVNVHRVRDLGGSFSVATANGGWTRALYTEAINTPVTTNPVVPAGFANRARICVDGWGNVYVPARPGDSSLISVFGISPTNTYICRATLPGTVVDSNGLTGSNGVACLQTRDDFGVDVINRTESLWVASELSVEASSDVRPNNVHRVNLVSSTPNGEPSRRVVAVGVAGGNIRWFDSGGVYVPTLDTDVPDPPLSAAAPFVSSTVAFGKVFFTDGSVYRYLDCHLKKVFTWKATDGGKMPSSARLLETWRARGMLAGGIDRQNWHATELGNFFHFDERPEEPTQIQAISGNNARAGKPSDIVTALVPWDEDTLLIGGDNTIYRLSGDPMAGGTIDRASSRLDLISPTVGMAFGNSWCRNREGLMYFHDNVGAVHVMTAGAQPTNISTGRVETAMRSVNLNTFRPVLAYDSDSRLVHVLYCANSSANASASTRHFIFEEDTLHESGAWWSLTFGSIGLQPTCTAVMEGDDPDDRTLLIGCVDGFVRVFDSARYDDDGVAISSRVLIGPLAPEQSESEFSFDCVEAEFANDQGGASGSLYATDRADFLGSPKRSFVFAPGRNPPMRGSARGAYVALEVGSSQAGNRWALSGSIHLKAVVRGVKRVRQ